MKISDEMFKNIIFKLKNGEKISTDMSEILSMIKVGNDVAQKFLLEFLNKILESKNYNDKVMNVINDFLSDKIDISTLSYKLFNEGKIGYEEYDDLFDESLILHDNLKRGMKDYIYRYNRPQFYYHNESNFEKMIRVLFEFTRGDEPYLRGVCFDYCMFLSALDIAKHKNTDFIIMCGVDTSREINYFLVRKNGNSEVLDPYNGVYTDIKNYKVRGILGSITLDSENLTEYEDDDLIHFDKKF